MCFCLLHTAAVTNTQIISNIHFQLLHAVNLPLRYNYMDNCVFVCAVFFFRPTFFRLQFSLCYYSSSATMVLVCYIYIFLCSIWFADFYTYSANEIIQITQCYSFSSEVVRACYFLLLFLPQRWTHYSCTRGKLSYLTNLDGPKE